MKVRAIRHWHRSSGDSCNQDISKQTGPNCCQIRSDEMAHETRPNTLPADLGAPPFVESVGEARVDDRTRLFAGRCFVGHRRSIDQSPSACMAIRPDAHLRVRGWWTGSSHGAVCSGGKWGLLLRRPLEAMSRTLPLVFAYWIVIALSLRRLYLWAAVVAM